MSTTSPKQVIEELKHIQNKDIVEIGESERTPEVYFNKHEGIIKFVGRTMPENSKEFFDPLITWMEQYVKDPNNKTSLYFDLEYFNSSASKLILKTINTFEPVKRTGNELIIEWYYMEDDDDMLEAGKNFEELTNLPFDFICY